MVRYPDYQDAFTVSDGSQNYSSMLSLSFRQATGSPIKPHSGNYFISVLFFFLVTIISFSANGAAKSAESSSHPSASDSQLENNYQNFLSIALPEVARKSSEFSLSENTLTALVTAVLQAQESGNLIRVSGLILANKVLMNTNADAEALQILTRALLNAHAISLAEDVLRDFDNSGNDYLVAGLKFEFVKYFAMHAQWDQALKKLNEIDIANTLPKQEGDEAFILLGACLQHQKKHREAVGYYERINENSEHYREAQLNIAIAYIRQDWWTDAQMAIKKALEASPAVNDELANRLYTVMGYSQLQHGFYRDARESFRNINVKSQYANRALLGLGMSALHQEDFIGALNAFNHLKKKTDQDMSVFESYLLAAFSLEKLKQQKTATAGYHEAISFYQQQSSTYENMIGQLRDKNQVVQGQTSGAINADMKRIQPELSRLSAKIEILDKLAVYPLSNKSRQAMSLLSKKMTDSYVDQAIAALTERQTVIDGYLSQARFGLAKLYDTK